MPDAQAAAVLLGALKNSPGVARCSALSRRGWLRWLATAPLRRRHWLPPLPSPQPTHSPPSCPASADKAKGKKAGKKGGKKAAAAAEEEDLDALLAELDGPKPAAAAAASAAPAAEPAAGGKGKKKKKGESPFCLSFLCAGAGEWNVARCSSGCWPWGRWHWHSAAREAARWVLLRLDAGPTLPRFAPPRPALSCH